MNGPLVYSETVSSGWSAGLRDEVVDQLDLVGLLLGDEALARLLDGQVLAHEGSAAPTCARMHSSIAGKSSSEIATPAGNSKS